MSEFPNCEIKLCDLEVSRVIQDSEQIREIIGTPDYVGENIRCLNYRAKIIFAVSLLQHLSTGMNSSCSLPRPHVPALLYSNVPNSTHHYFFIAV